MADETTDTTNVAGIEIYEGEDGQYYWRGRAANGEIVAQGEGYVEHGGAVDGAHKVFPGVEISPANTATEGDREHAQRVSPQPEVDDDPDQDES